MRVHSLSVTAFGPFADTQTIDFDGLSESGIFLLTGKTGSGKTSVLDAICFGLYGAVPGARNGARDLRSHHAAPGVQPVVTLEVTIRDRRLRLTRSPAWRRQSRRARGGLVDVNARANAAELVDGNWIALSARLDEVGHLVTSLLGMNKDQFCQVVMLPQGQFETFLRSGAKERHDVLESLFETGRFQRIEAWLNARRRDTEQACTAHRRRLDDVLARIEEANGSPLPADEEPAAAVTSAIGTLEARIADGHERVAELHSTLKSAVAALDEARLVVTRQAEFAAARRRIEELDATAEIAVARADAINRSAVAERLLPLLDLAERATRRERSLARELDDAESSCDRLPLGHVQQARERLVALTALRQIDDAIASLAASDTDLTSELDRCDERLEEMSRRSDSLSSAIRDARDGADRARTVPPWTEASERALADAIAATEAANDVDTLAAEVMALSDSESTCRAAQLEAKQRWLEARERHLDGIAAALAETLVDGVACAVCGSLDHPRPARSSPTQVRAADEDAARRRFDDADEDLGSVAKRLEDARRRMSDARVRSHGDAAPVWHARAEELRCAREEAAASGLELRRLLEDVAGFEADAEALRGAIVELAAHRSAIAARRQTIRDEAARQGRLIEAQLDGQPDLESAIAALTALVRQREHAAQVRRDLTTARDDSLQLRRASEASLADAGFSSAEQARAAVLTAQEVATAEALNRARDTDRAVAMRVLNSPAHVESSTVGPPDLACLDADVEVARTSAEERGRQLARDTDKHRRMSELSCRLVDLSTSWAPLVRARDEAASAAAMCAGTAADNKTKTKLSHYVLAARLASVVAAASQRLDGISGGRYQLVHAMERGVFDTRGGLGLRIVDNHTGQLRDPATLSGGETFYVSLALALGLADLVRDEIGGVELATLFVDEGFGSLDAETLDEVLDVVDSLRSGGRCVGLVSHLPALRDRIPAQLRLVDHRHGSTIAAR